MRRYHEKDITKLPGFAAHEDGGGFEFDSPDGRVVFRNMKPMDQTFWKDGLGHLNISLIERMIANEKARPHHIKLEESTIEHIRLIDVDPQIVAKMTVQRRNQPLLAVMTSRGLEIIDGNHRLKRRILDGCTFYRAYILDAEILRHVQVSIFHRGTNGKWVRDKLNTNIESAIEGAEDVWQKQISRGGPQ